MPSVVRYPVTLLDWHATPKNVRMADFLPPVVRTTPVVQKVYLINAPEILPLPAEVLAGVSYGESGVEFVGTLSGGVGYPLEADVEFGVVYGSASEKTGDFYVPAQSDVKLGVGYGAAGTEFTGSFAGGGGAARPIGSPVVRRVK